MLRNTFCHIPGISTNTEKKIWSCGLHSWEDFLSETSARIPFGKNKIQSTRIHIEQSMERLQQLKPEFFAGLLPTAEQWRLFAEFQRTTAYLDIETSGMGNPNDYITTVALYDGKSVRYFVKDKNLDEFGEQIREYKLLVTYNGKSFDVPFIRRVLKIPMDQAHIDLRYVLGSLGYRGGLKACEKKLGIDRGDLDGMDGFFAVILWNDYSRNNNHKALETLLAYNIQDVVNLEMLMCKAHNLKLKETPFAASHLLALPTSPSIPFSADIETIEKIRQTFRY